MDAHVRKYISAIPKEKRALFDRLQRLILDTKPDAAVVFSYKMPTYTVGRRRLFLGVWEHGVSLYGWDRGRDGGFSKRHPELMSGRTTIRLRPDDASRIPDKEFHDLVRGALDD